jgi:hypothetical protein
VQPTTVSMSQTVTYDSLGAAAQYAGDTKTAYDCGYGQHVGIQDASCTSLSGNSLTGTIAASGRRSVQVSYQAQVTQALLAAAVSAANNANATDNLQTAINRVITTLYPNSSVPAAVVSSVTVVEVTAPANSGALSPGYSAMTQSISFSPAITFSGNTEQAYTKGYGAFLGIYTAAAGGGAYADAETSVVGYATSRRTTSSISFISKMNCATYPTAYYAALDANAGTLKAAIQSVITTEYSSLASASTPSMTTVVVAPSGYCSLPGDDDGLSGGAIAGIVVGSVVGFFILVGIVVYVMRSGHADAPAAPTPSKPAETFSSAKAESVQAEDPECGRACC